MIHTYSQIHIHVIFVVKNRQSLISSEWKKELYDYISGIIEKQGHKLLAINGPSDHLHIFFGMRPNQSLSDLMQDIKADSTRWINRKRFLSTRFAWQECYGAFSYSKSQVSRVVRYIQNQEKHHEKRNMRDEYIEFLDRFGVEYNEKYIFKPV